MGRQQREKSQSGIYHVMLRGIDRRALFFEDEDREKFMWYLKRAKEKSGFLLYGYCLMDNHIHALLKEGDEELGQSIKRITVGYVQWHNVKYARVGHLFQNRYRSEVVEDDAYFLTVLRYIHQNPTKAKIVDDISYYKWSSFKEYIRVEDTNYVDTDFVKKLFFNEEQFIRFMKMPSKAKCLGYEVKIRITDEKLKKEISQILKVDQLMDLPKEEREKLIAVIKEETKASNRQLSRVLGIRRSIIDKI